ncbi:hypothetical protein ABLE93_14945 [Xanthobacter sp. KR7-65]
MSSTGTTAPLSRRLRAGAFSTARLSDAQDESVARFSSKLIDG